MQRGPEWFEEARSQIGVKEIVGPKHSDTVLGYARDAHVDWIKDDETPWCAVFACAMLERTGTRSPRSAAARSFMQWGAPIDTPRLGCIAVFTRNGGGHVAFYVKEDDEYVYVLGGNQSNQVSVAAYPKSRLLGYRWPTDEDEIWDAIPLHDDAPVPGVHEAVHMTQPNVAKAPVVTESAPKVTVTHSDVEKHLRESGSRIVTNADQVETISKVGVGTSALAVVASLFKDVWSSLAPVVTAFKDAAPYIAVGLFIYLIFASRVIRWARVDDTRRGKTKV